MLNSPYSPIIWTVVGVIAVPLCLYVIFLGLGATPYFQRQ